MDPHDKSLLKNALLIAGSFVVFLWLIELAEFWYQTSFSHLGIYPRRFQNLTGIITGPWVHGDWGHIWSNTVPLFVSLTAILYMYHQIAPKVVLWIYGLTGFWVWLGGAESYHIGASGLVYGFVVFLFFSGLLRKDSRGIALSMLVTFLYGGMVWGIFPGQEGISWESHLFGAIAGAGVAWFLRKKGPQPKKYDWEDEPDDEEDPRDAHAIWNYQNQSTASNQEINYEYKKKNQEGD